MKIFFLVFCLLIILNSCNINRCGDPAPSILPLSFWLIDENKTDSLDSFKFFYKDLNGMHFDSISKQKVPDTIPGQKTFFFEAPNTKDLSLNGIKTFYLKRSFKTTDTIYFDVQRSKEGCYSLNSFKYNGKDVDYYSQIIVK